MNYSVVKNKAELDKFISILPDPTSDQTYYFVLQTRGKLLKVPGGKEKSLRLFTSSKKHMYQNILQCESTIGSYYFNDRDVLQGEFTLYMCPNPRSFSRASWLLVKELIDLKQRGNEHNTYREAMTAIHRAKDKSVFAHFDFDIMADEVLPIKEKISNILQSDNFYCVRTNGGCHILVPLEKFDNQRWYQEIVKLGVDQSKDLLIPVPGCVQGDFVPYFV
jgi:hypothetical protein